MTWILEEIEADIAPLKAMQAKVENEMGVVPEPVNKYLATLPRSREEVDSHSIYVGSVHHACTPEEVQQYFASCGAVNMVIIKTNCFRICIWRGQSNLPYGNLVKGGYYILVT